MTELKLEHLLILFLRLGAFCCFAGWTWVHFYWEGPYGVLFWQDGTYALAEKFGSDWDEFVGSGANDGLIQKWMTRIGWLFLAASLITLTVQRKKWGQITALIGGSGLLILLSYAKFVEAQRQLPMFIEHGGQMLAPLLLVSALSFGARDRITVSIAIIAFITTFAGHGAYALGIPYPTPANFMGMTSVILHAETETARAFLRVVGAIDIVICIGLFIPAIRRWAALYGAIWGLLTALARPVAGMSTDLHFWGADQFLHEAILRAPHILIPLYLFFVWQSSPQNETPDEHLISDHIETSSIQ